MGAMTVPAASAGSPGRARRTRRTRAQAREEILEAAGAAFVELGYDAASLEEIAHRVGVTRTGVLYHFHSKDALLIGLVSPVVAESEDLLARAAGSADLTPAQRRGLVEGMFDIYLRHRDACEVLVRFRNTIATLDIGAALVKTSAELMLRLGGSAYRTDPTVRLRVATAVATMRGLVASRLPVELGDVEQRRILVDIIDGILTRPV
jgi:AcrR family transcriptional regulator